MSSYDQTLATTSPAPLVSRRICNGLCFGLLTASFATMFVLYSGYVSGALDLPFASTTSPMAYLIWSSVGSFAGVIIMGKGRKMQSVGISLVGYALFSITFGLTLAMAITRYTTQTITVSLGITFCLAGIFLIAGVIFPEIFAAIGRILMLSLITLIAAELVSVLFFGAGQSLFDFATIAIFCGFIGYDTHRLAMDEPTIPNAIFHACDIYIDMANILIRVLRLLGRS